MSQSKVKISAPVGPLVLPIEEWVDARIRQVFREVESQLESYTGPVTLQNIARLMRAARERVLSEKSHILLNRRHERYTRRRYSLFERRVR